MSTNPYYVRAWKLERYRVGPLGPYLDGFSEYLYEKGYAQSAGQRYVREVGRLSRWMAERGVEVSQLREEVVIRFSRARKRGRRCRVQMAPYQLFLEHLRGENSLSPVEEQLVEETTVWAEHYRTHLVQRQGLAPETVRKYVQVAHELLSHCFGKEKSDFSQLQPGEITRYLVDRCAVHSRGRAGGKASALRSFLRYAYCLGHTPSDLSRCVPSVPRWRHANPNPFSLLSSAIGQRMASSTPPSFNCRAKRAFAVPRRGPGREFMTCATRSPSEPSWRSTEAGARSSAACIPYRSTLAIPVHRRPTGTFRPFLS